MSHPETVTLPPVQDVVKQPEPSKRSTPEPSKVLTGVKEKPLTNVQKSKPEKLKPKIDTPPQKNNFSGTGKETKPLIFSGPKFPKKMHFKGKVGRQRTNEQVIDLLTLVQARNGAWPNDNYVSEQMRRYYRRQYPEYFRKARKKGSTGKVQTARSTPIDLQSRRTGTGV